MKRVVLCCLIISSGTHSFAWRPTIGLDKETRATVDTLKQSIDQFPSLLGEEIKNIISTSQTALHNSLDHSYIHIKALPIVGLGSISALYALYLMHNNIQEMYAQYKGDNPQQSKTYAYYALASAALCTLSLVTIAKSDVIITFLARL